MNVINRVGKPESGEVMSMRIIVICILLGMVSVFQPMRANSQTKVKVENNIVSKDTIYQDVIEKVVYSSLKRSNESAQTFSIVSPNENIRVEVTLAPSQISYTVSKEEQVVLKPSVLNLKLSTGNLVDGLVCVASVKQQVDDKLNLPYGERKDYRNHYNEMQFSLSNSNSVECKLTFRVYNEGVAFQFSFPENDNYSSVRIQGETTQFALPADMTAYIEPYNENGYTPKTISQSFSRTLIPLTLTSDGLCVCINEAANDNYPRIGLSGLGDGLLQSIRLGSSSSLKTPFSCPWRYMVIGEKPSDLVEGKEMMYGLNAILGEEQNAEWIKPGKVFRCVQLNTEMAKNSIDFCVEMNLQYMMFDAGWYGLGYGQSKERDPASDPTDVVDEIDMKAVCAYAEEKGIGIILYINKVGWNCYDNETMLDLYQSWGIKGLKLGFMDGYSAYGIQQVYSIVRGAYERNMVVNVHDEFRNTGMVFKYPNLLTAEGIKGNESIRNTGDHTTLLPFTRFLSGAADYTICYKGNDPEFNVPSVLNTTRGHQLAISVIFYSPLQHVFWYAIPGIYWIPEEVEFFKEVPTTWDDFKVSDGIMGEYASMARRKGDVWYLGTIGSNTEQSVTIPLDFLDANLDYDVIIYKDALEETIVKYETTLSALREEGVLTDEGLAMELWASGGQVCLFEPRVSTNIFVNKEESGWIIYPNPTSDMVTVKNDQSSDKHVDIKVFSLDGIEVYRQKISHLKNQFTLDLSFLAGGAYVMVIQAENEVKSLKFVVRK